MTDKDTPPPGTPAPCVLILALVPAVREGLAGLLDAEGFRPLAAGSSAEALPQILLHRPDVAVVDIRLADSTVVEFCRAARALLPPLRFLLLTSYEDDLSIQEAVLAGASGLVLRQLLNEALIAAVRLTASGATLLNAAVRTKVIQDFSAAVTTDGQRRAGLTLTEGSLLSLVAQGIDDEHISATTTVSFADIPKILRHALAKLGIEPLDHTGPSPSPPTPF